MKRILWLVLAGQIGFSASATASANPNPRILHDRVDGTSRHLTVVLETDHGCAPAISLVVAAPFVAMPRTNCAVTISGPSDARVSITTPTGTYTLDARAADATPVPPPTTTGKLSLSILPRSSVPVGDVVNAAYLIATDKGRPTNSVDLHVTIDGASPRALRWVAPGVAEIDVAVPTWRPEVGLTVDGGGTTASTKVPVDPGPPVDIRLDVPSIEVDEPFAIAPHVRTQHGVEVATERVRVVVDGCIAQDAGFRCPAGPRVATIELSLDGEWVPIEQQTLEVHARVPTVVRPAPGLGLELALRGGRTVDMWSTGLRVEGQHELAPRRRLLASASWRYARNSLRGESPFASDPVFTEQEVAIAAGMAWTWSRALPLFVRATGGFALVHARLGGEGVADLGVRGLVELAGGATRDRFSVSLGVRGSRDLVVAGWNGDPIEVFAEASYALLD